MEFRKFRINKENSSLKELSFFTKYLAQKGLISGSEGNLSVKTERGFWITPAGKIKEILKPEDLVFVFWNKIFVNGFPSSEWGMHYQIYLKNLSVFAIVHTHPPYTLLLDAIGFDFKRFFLPEASLLLREVKKIPYLEPGSENLWECASEVAKTCKIILLSKHGLLTIGKTLEEAVNLTLILEKLSFLEVNLLNLKLKDLSF